MGKSQRSKKQDKRYMGEGNIVFHMDSVEATLWNYTSLDGKTLAGTMTVTDVYAGSALSATAGTDGTLSSTGELSYEWHRVNADGNDDIVGTDAAYTTTLDDAGCTFYAIARDADGTYAGWVKSNDAKCKKPADVKYAVQLLGIQADTAQDGHTIGLTFGPATGDNYVAKYKSHTPTGTTGTGNAKRCIHNDDWATIADWAKKDPHVYDDCLANGCTVSVPLSLTGKAIGSGSYQTVNATGDGYGCLYKAINSKYRAWNGTGSDYNNAGGWGASFIRRTLNGSDACPEDISTCKQGADVLTSDQALISCFPDELKDNIVAKAVKTDTVYNDTKNSNKTTYDKLWLLSYTEVWADGGSNNSNLRPLEGSQYAKFSSWDVTTKDYAKAKAYSDSSSSGSANRWWLRSSSTYNSHGACNVSRDGGWGYSYVYYAGWAVAPGFCVG